MRPLHPNAGIEADYRECLVKLVDRMHRSFNRWLKAAYRANEPAILAVDEEPTDRLTAAEIERLRRLYDGGDPRLPGVQEPVYSLERKGLIRTKPQPQGHQATIEWILTEAGEAVAASFATPASKLGPVVARLAQQWQKRFDDAAPKLAEYFAKKVNERSAANLKAILKQGGFSVPMTMTPVMRDVLDATIAQNIALIKSIPAQYHTEVQGLVMRSVQTGRDLGTLAGELEKRYGVTKRRAALIARDQNNKATSAMTHARQTSLGITTNVWMHSRAGKEPRPTHVAMNGKTYEISKGMYDPAERRYILPGELINCRCTSRPVIPGFE
jgi:SPP1 gp7 family putative phage head morphogenesis protein